MGNVGAIGGVVAGRPCGRYRGGCGPSATAEGGIRLLGLLHWLRRGTARRQAGEKGLSSWK